MNRVLLVVDDEGLRKGLMHNLSDLGFRLSSAPLGKDALVQIWEAPPDLILIGDRANWQRARILCEELRQDEDTRDIRLIALIPEGGAFRHWDLVDDFIMLPCRPQELELRVQQIQRRRGLRLSGETISIGDLIIDFSSYEVFLRGLPLSLTYREYELLKFLVTHPNRVFDRETLLRKVWSYETYVGTRTVDIHIRRLRSKLGQAGSGIQTVRNVGYKFTFER